MQSGTTGINTVRIYNPIKQGLDHDPEGVFIRRWLPELAPLPAVFLHQPWLLDPEQQQQLGWQLGRDYPQPIVEPEGAARQARERIYARRQELGFAALADAIQQRHGSRRAGLPATGSGPRRRRRDAGVPGQLQLDLGC